MGFGLVFRKIKKAARTFFGRIRKPKKNSVPRKQTLPEKPAIEKSANQRPHLALVSGAHAASEFSQVQLSSHTQRAYARDLKDFLDWLRVKNLLETWGDQVGPIEIAEFREYLLHVKGLSKSSITRKIAVLKSFFRWALARGWVDRNPAELVRAYPQTQDSKTGFLNSEQTHVLLDSLPEIVPGELLSECLRSVVVGTLLMLAVRREEASKIRLGDIEFSDHDLLVNIQGKGDRARRLPVPDRLQALWRVWMVRLLADESPPLGEFLEIPMAWQKFFESHAAQPLFVSTRSVSRDKPLSTSEIARIVRKSGRKAQILQRLSPHMLRATAITHALDQGASHRGVQQMAGWTTPLMISRYDKRRKDPKHSAIHQLKYAHRDSDEHSSRDLIKQESTPVDARELHI